MVIQYDYNNDSAMSFQQSARYLQRAGVTPALDVSGVEMPDIRTRQDLDALRDRGIREMEEQGHSYSFMQWQAALQAGLDEILPDLEIANGIPRSIEETAAMVADAEITSQRYFDPATVDPFIAQLGWQNLPVQEVRDRLSVALLEAPEHERGSIMKAIAAVENSGHSGFTTISYDMPEERLEVFANSSDSAAALDPYSSWRNNQGFNPDHGLEGLKIEKSINSDPLFSGITSMNPDGGGVYSVSADWALAEAQSEGESIDD